MRFPLLPNPPTFPDPEDQELVERIKAQRGPAGLSELDLALLHSPKVVAGWKAFFGSIRAGASIKDSIRECVICRIGVLNLVAIEWVTHSPMLQKASDASITAEGLAYIENTPAFSHKLGSPGPGGLEDRHIAVLAYTDAVTKDLRVPDSVFDELKNHFDSKQIIDITTLVAAYNCVSRIVVPLQLFGSV